MERTALRLATVATLLNGGNGPPWPTLAGEFCYDSMIDDVVDVVPARRKPVVIVRTDDDQSVYKGFTFATRQVRLLIEYGVLTASTVKTSDGSDHQRVDWPRTDSALEAFLDMLEWQIYAALFGSTQWATWWQSSAASVSAYSSVPRFSPPERGAVRLAVRTIQVAMNIPGECLPRLVKEFGQPYAPMLPPSLVAVIDTILAKGGGDFRKSIAQIKATIDRYGPLPLPTAPPLQRVWSTTMAPLYESDSDFRIEQDIRIEQEAPFTVAPLIAQPPILGSPTLG